MYISLCYPLQREEEEKLRLLMESTLDIQRHRIDMVLERERKEREEQEANKNMLTQKRAHDLQVSGSSL